MAVATVFSAVGLDRVRVKDGRAASTYDRSEEKILSLYYGSDSARVAVLSAIARALLPANIDIYLGLTKKATLISGRNLPDISTVVGRAVTSSTREGIGWPWLAPARCLLPGTIPWRRWIRPSGWLPFMSSRLQGLAPR